MSESIVQGENKLTVGIGWDAKKVDLKGKIQIAIDNIFSATSEHTYDLNLAAIVEHNDGSQPELVFWGHKYNKKNSVVLKADDRTGEKDGIDEEMRIYLDKGDNISRVILFLYIYNGNLHKQCLAEVDNIFALVKGKHTEKVYIREDSIFKTSPEASSNNCYVFGEVAQEDGKWIVRGKSQFLHFDKSEDIFEYYTSTHYVPED
jgi:tellurium resistance protein TerD